jgi:hypothetical protein
MKLSRLIVPKSLLFAVFAFPGLLTPAFAQQEVDPTWYDPWAAAPKTARPLHAKADQKKTTQRSTFAVTGSKRNQPTPVSTHVPHRTQRAAVQVALK